MTDAVKPCPFCGGESATNTVRYSEAHVKEQGWKQYEFYGVNCIVCGADNRGLVGHSTKEKAIEAWNHRAPPAGWKPIETAPDGITVLVANISSNGQVNWVRDGIRGKGVMRLTWYTLNGNHIPTPTHFTDLPNGLMPLPAAPENDDE